MKFKGMCRLFVMFGLMMIFLSFSTPTFLSTKAKTQRYTSAIEFDYVRWELNAISVKLTQTGIDPWQVLSLDQQHQLVMHYFSLVTQLETLQVQLMRIYSDPTIKNPNEFAKGDLMLQEELQQDLISLTPLAESILQAQVNEIIVEEGIAKMGGAFPPVLFHTTPLPKALIVSPRDKIQQEVNISLLADLTLEQIADLEEKVAKATGASVLVVDVGGIGIYPTMVMRTSNLPWILDTIAHEWTHNFLTLRPLGLNYDLTPELRTMNETTAAIAGGEISRKVTQRYYPEYSSMPEDGVKFASLTVMDRVFDFRAEMHITRVHVDELLAAGKIEEAEQYMEERRIDFVNHGYDIRKLNQAYFAFHGAYAEQPGGAAGEDPVGPAVRELRAKSDSLAEFLQVIGKMNSYEDLLAFLDDSN